MTQPLILLPGMLCDAELWRHQTETLGDIAAIQVPDLGRYWSIGEMAASVLAVAPDRFAMAGLSMGGYVAQEIMLRAPERVTRLALLDTRARAYSAEIRATRERLLRQAQHGRFDGVTPRLIASFVHPDRLGDAVLTRSIAEMTRRVGRDAYIRQQTAVMARRDMRHVLPGIACPTLVLCGREDAVTPLADHEEMAALIPGATLTVIDRCGHLAPMEHPETVSRAMRGWLVA